MDIRTQNLVNFIKPYIKRQFRYNWGASGITRLENIYNNPLKSIKEIKTLECGELVVFLFDRMYWLTDGEKYQNICLERQTLNDSQINFAKKEMYKEEYYA